jgi:hypothetical protein
VTTLFPRFDMPAGASDAVPTRAAGRPDGWRSCIVEDEHHASANWICAHRCAGHVSEQRRLIRARGRPRCPSRPPHTIRHRRANLPDNCGQAAAAPRALEHIDPERPSHQIGPEIRAGAPATGRVTPVGVGRAGAGRRVGPCRSWRGDDGGAPRGTRGQDTVS